MFGWGLKVKARRLVNGALNTCAPGRKVDFIIVGAQKAGTTAIDHYLRQHGDVSMAVRKEVHFFDGAARDVASLAGYHSFFQFWRRRRLYGEATPCYMAAPGAIERIVSYNPDVKLLVSLRDPVDRAYSAWNMERQRNREQRTFLTAIEEEIATLNSLSEPVEYRAYYLGRSLYCRQLDAMFSAIDSSRVLVVRNEKLRAGDAEEYAKICAFLGIEFLPPRHRSVHAREYARTISDREREVAYRFLQPDMERLGTLLSWNLAECWCHDQLNTLEGAS